jgi:hypothetical protein
MYYGNSFPNNNNNNQIITQNDQFNMLANNQIQNQNRNKIKKRVNFNTNVDVVQIESYKEFNKLDEKLFPSFNSFVNNFYCAQKDDILKQKHKKDCCSCIIL